MASPSAEGLGKEEIKKRLAQIKKEYDHMQRKLEKSDKAARAKAHVKKKIAEHAHRQSLGGSPECTTIRQGQKSVRGDERSSFGRPCSRSSPSYAAGCRGHTVSKDPGSGSSKDRNKRRSVSFQLESELDEPTLEKQFVADGDIQMISARESKRNQLREIKGRESILGRTESKHASQNLANVKDPTESTRDSPISFKSRKSQTKDVSEPNAGGRAGRDCLKQHTVRTNQSESFHHLKSCGKLSSHIQSSLADIRTSPEQDRTPPDDTQVDLFADSTSQDDSPLVFEVSQDPEEGSEELVIVDSVLPDKHIENTLTTTPKTSSVDPVCSGSVQANKISDTCKISSSSTVKIAHGAPSPNHELSLNKRSWTPVVDFSKGDMGGESAYEAKLSEDPLDCDDDDDPDVIPGTYSEEGNENCIAKSSVFLKEKHTKFIHGSRERQSPLSVGELGQQISCGQVTSVYISDDGVLTEDNRNAHMTVGSDNAYKADSCLPGTTEVTSACTPNAIENDEVAVIAVDSEPVASFENEKQSPLVQQVTPLQASDHSKVKPREDKNSDSECGNEQRKGRRRRQKSIDNLTMEDISLKDFVLSQNTQEGNHTWIDGLMYPAEYYVRKTRSMSRSSPDQHSAPVTSRELSKCSKQKRKSATVHTHENVQVYSDPVSLQTGNHTSHINKADDASCRVSDPATPALSLGPQGPTSCASSHPDSTMSVEAKECHSNRRIKVSRKAASKKKKRVQKSSKNANEQATKHGTDSGVQDENLITESLRDGSELEDCSVKTFHSKDSHGLSFTSSKGEDCGVLSAENTTSLITHHYPEKQGIQRLSAHENRENVIEASVSEIIKKPSNTQASRNLLESQYSQSQLPDNFALPEVFGSPGRPSPGFLGWSPGTPTSSSYRLPRRLLGSSTSQEKRSSVSQERNEHLLQSSAGQDKCIQEFREEIAMTDSSVKQRDDTVVDPSGTGIQIHCEPCLDRKECTSYAALPMKLSSLSAKVVERNLVEGSLTALPLVVGMEVESIPSCRDTAEPMLSGTQRTLPSSVCSNVHPESPNAGAATGTPPEEAEMPQTQSQCVESCKEPSQNPDSQEEMSYTADGSLDIQKKNCLWFKGCLEHKVPSSDGVLGLVTSQYLTDKGSESVLLVYFHDTVFFWSHDPEQECQYNLLSVWKSTKLGEKISSVLPVSGQTKRLEALVMLRTETGSETIRFIQFDSCMSEWEERTILSSRDVGGQHHFQPWCVLSGRRAATGVSMETGEGEVQVLGLGASGASPICLSLPKTSARTSAGTSSRTSGRTRLLSLTEVQGTPDMLLGMADSVAFLWHIPSMQLVQMFTLVEQSLACIHAIAESGLLFMVTHKMDDAKTGKPSENDPLSCSLLVLNPASCRSSKLLDYTAPCFKPGVRIMQASVSEGALAVCLSSGTVCLWDLYSSKLLLMTSIVDDTRWSSVCLHDKHTLLLGEGHCVNVFQKQPQLSH
ncbi:uncharacterized protein [Diadema setosum]|uniref:uncharacterized protein n=1 Tax=Diadema setosum TaxID=31175 RepID=UPI003B3AB0D5